MNRKDRQICLEILERDYYQESCALDFGTPFQLLISTMLAAQCTDKRVNEVTRDLFIEYPDAKAFAALEPQELEPRIKPCGLYKAKARNIVLTCRALEEKYQGRVPDDMERLVQLPGVGRKTANVVLSVGFGQPAIAVDTHVFRVTNRLGLAKADNVTETENQLMRNIPKEKWSQAHHWLIWHGRRVCAARKPRCEVCHLNACCDYGKKAQKNKG